VVFVDLEISMWLSVYVFILWPAFSSTQFLVAVYLLSQSGLVKQTGPVTLQIFLCGGLTVAHPPKIKPYDRSKKKRRYSLFV